MAHRIRRRRGLNLIEVVFAIPLLGLGMIMTAATLSLSVRDTAEGNDLVTSQLAAHAVGGRLLREAGTLQLPADGEQIRWFCPDLDAGCRPAGGLGADRWVVNRPDWGTAIPCPSDARYACQIFYRRRGGKAPFDWDFFVVVQARREGLFAPPVFGAPPGPVRGDLMCDAAGRWSRGGEGRPAVAPVYTVPGGVAVYHVGLCF